ncbi:hypothetical protein ZWY2020_000563 [Hordeum vulgare]|nr:hypothetical protein ZWY2020_000563 [Hordeum vulgare]
MMEGAAGAGQAPERRPLLGANPLPPRRTAHRLGGPSGLPPVRETSAAVRAGDRPAGSGAGSEPPSMDFSQPGFVFLWIRCERVGDLSAYPEIEMLSSLLNWFHSTLPS